jgi:hypothetical protein
MSNKKETPVSWLMEQILELPLDEGTNAAHLKKHVNKVTVFDYALQMESKKQQKYDEMLAMLEKASDALTSSDAYLRKEIEQLIKEAKEL